MVINWIYYCWTSPYWHTSRGDTIIVRFWFNLDQKSLFATKFHNLGKFPARGQRGFRNRTAGTSPSQFSGERSRQRFLLFQGNNCQRLENRHGSLVDRGLNTLSCCCCCLARYLPHAILTTPEFSFGSVCQPLSINQSYLLLIYGGHNHRYFETNGFFREGSTP